MIYCALSILFGMFYVEISIRKLIKGKKNGEVNVFL
jgi:hypothetical protein